jgi:addiction module HigA family antidote
VLRRCIEPLGLSITDSTAALGVTRTTPSELVNERRGISPEMAVRLSKVFGGSAESWFVQKRSMICPSSRRPDETQAAAIGVSIDGGL